MIFATLSEITCCSSALEEPEESEATFPLSGARTAAIDVRSSSERLETSSLFQTFSNVGVTRTCVSVPVSHSRFTRLKKPWLLSGTEHLYRCKEKPDKLYQFCRARPHTPIHVLNGCHSFTRLSIRHDQRFTFTVDQTFQSRALYAPTSLSTTMRRRMRWPST